MWQQFRTPFLAGISSSVFLVLGQVLIAPLPEKTSAEVVINLPPEVPLVGWQTVSERSAAESSSGNTTLPPSDREYHYVQNGVPLEIEMRYLNSGRFDQYFRYYKPSPPQLEIRQYQGIGSYGVFVHQERAYLTACINPWKTSTFTQEEYRQEQDSAGMRWDRLIPWFMGRAQLRDSGCLWTHLSTPLVGKSPEASYQVLEKIWPTWYSFWSDNFPET